MESEVIRLEVFRELARRNEGASPDWLVEQTLRISRVILNGVDKTPTEPASV